MISSLADGPLRFSELSRQLAGVEDHVPEVRRAQARYDSHQELS